MDETRIVLVVVEIGGMGVLDRGFWGDGVRLCSVVTVREVSSIISTKK